MGVLRLRLEIEDDYIIELLKKFGLDCVGSIAVLPNFKL